MWWLEFLPIFYGASLIKPSIWDFADLQFATDASLHGAETTCLDFSENIVCAAKHITGLEFYTVIVEVEFWAPDIVGGNLSFRATLKLS